MRWIDKIIVEFHRVEPPYTFPEGCRLVWRGIDEDDEHVEILNRKKKINFGYRFAAIIYSLHRLSGDKKTTEIETKTQGTNQDNRIILSLSCYVY
jgi:hypothetical protein